MSDPGSTQLRDVPKTFWVGLAVGVLAFFVSISSLSMRIVNGERTSCSYTDYGGLIAAVICLMCVPAAWQSRRQRHVARQSALWVMAVGSVVLVGLAAVHALRGLGFIGGPCN
jgi:hypothetical protein